MLGRNLRCGALHQTPAHTSALPVVAPFHAVRNLVVSNPLLTRISPSRSVAACAKRGPSFSVADGKFGFEREEARWKVKLDSSRFEVADKDLMNLLPFGLVAVGGLSIVFGPILFGLAIAAGAAGFALTVASTFLPLIIFMIGGGFFASMIMMGFGFVVPLMVAGGIATVGGFALTSIAKTLRPKPTVKSPSSSKSSFAQEEEPKEDPEAEERAEAKTLNQDLDDFDQMLADRERKRKLDNWEKTKNTKY